MLELIVCQDGSMSDENVFPTIMEAIGHLPKESCDEAIIKIMPGTYHEKVTLDRPNVRMVGTDAKDCIITFGDFARDLMPDGSKRGTFRSYTFLLDADKVTLENLTIKNSSCPRSKAGQAIALYADGDNLQIKSCRLESYQDTLFTGPLPPAPVQIGGFTGPKEFSERRVGKHYYKDCYICGDIDFIFGGAIAYFEDCEIASIYSEIPKSPKGEENEIPIYGYVTAASTPEGSPYGYVFKSCRFTSTCPDRSVYLGRPWRDFAQTVLIDCDLGPHIKPEGFHDWDKPNARQTVYYAEYQSHGPGAYGPSDRADFVHALSEDEAKLYHRGRVLEGFEFD